MEFNGTKAPWEAKNLLGYPRVGNAPYVLSGEELVVSLPSGGNGEEIEANAKLIAASPELLEAALVFKEGWDNFLDKTNVGSSFYSAREVTFMGAVGAVMDLAIKKALE